MDVLEQLIERAKSVGVSADLIRDNDCVFGYEASMSYHFWVDDGQYFFGSDERATTYSSRMWTSSIPAPHPPRWLPLPNGCRLQTDRHGPWVAFFPR